MKNSKLFYGFALLFLAGVIFFLGSKISKQSYYYSSSNKHSPSVLQDSMSISGVKKISSDCNCDVEIIPSNEEHVVFFYDKKYFENISEIKGEELNLDFHSLQKIVFGWRQNEGDIKVKIYTKGLNEISQQGVGMITCNSAFSTEELVLMNDGVGSMEFAINANKLKVENSGVGSIELKGNTNYCTLDNSGTGSIEANQLINKCAEVGNSGVGSVEVNASDSLALNNSGVGGITYSGSAVITKIVSDGVGTITKQ